jgi:hypothetical protein
MVWFKSVCVENGFSLVCVENVMASTEQFRKAAPLYSISVVSTPDGVLVSSRYVTEYWKSLLLVYKATVRTNIKIITLAHINESRVRATPAGREKSFGKGECLVPQQLSGIKACRIDVDRIIPNRGDVEQGDNRDPQHSQPVQNGVEIRDGNLAGN